MQCPTEGHRHVVNTRSLNAAQPSTDNESYSAPPGALTRTSAADRNRKLIPWRRVVSMTFAEQSRCLRVLWALSDLFNAKTGYAYPTNGDIANMTGIAENKVREALGILEADGAIIRSYVIRNGHKQRVIYPATALIPRPRWGGRGSPRSRGTIT